MTIASPISDQSVQALEHLADDLRELSARWLPHTGELRSFLERWERAWNTHDLDELEQMVSDDITWEDPAMHGETVHGRAEFRAFSDALFRAFPDTHFQGVGTAFFDLDGTGLGIRWRMTGTFTGEMAIWSKGHAREQPKIAPTGKAFDIEGVDFYTFRDGLVCDYSILYDLMGFSQQIGIFG